MNGRGVVEPHLSCFSLQALIQFKTVIVDLLEVDTRMVISCQTRLMQEKQSAIMAVIKHSPTIYLPEKNASKGQV